MTEETEKPEGATTTLRVVLKQERVIRVDELGEPTGDPLDAWVEVQMVESQNKVAAIEAVAGKRNTAEAVPGRYRAPTLSSWKGGIEHVRPDKPLVQSASFD